MLRRGIEIGKGMMPPDAYVDKDGKWHDDNEIWENEEVISKLLQDADDPEIEVLEYFSNEFYDYLDNQVEDDDYIVVIDAHC